MRDLATSGGAKFGRKGKRGIAKEQSLVKNAPQYVYSKSTQGIMYTNITQPAGGHGETLVGFA